MKKWPKKHINLFAVLIFSLILCVAGFFLFIKPLNEKIRKDREFIVLTKTELRKKEWPLDSERLQKLLEYKKGLLDKVKDGENAYKATGLRKKSELLLKECTNTFEKRIKKIFVNPSDFSKEITRLDYQDEYNKVRDKLARKDIYFSEESLMIEDDSEDALIYPKVLQVWLVDEVVSLASKNSLRVLSNSNVKTKNDRGKIEPVAKIQLLPVIPYVLYEKSDIVYVMEFPVRISLRGTLDKFSGLLRDMQAGGKYFPISRLQIRSLPKWQEGESKTILNNRILDIELECSAFFRFSDSPQKLKIKKIKLIPKGA